jgi:hypothetical protein
VTGEAQEQGRLVRVYCTASSMGADESGAGVKINEVRLRALKETYMYRHGG